MAESNSNDIYQLIKKHGPPTPTEQESKEIQRIKKLIEENSKQGIEDNILVFIDVLQSTMYLATPHRDRRKIFNQTLSWAVPDQTTIKDLAKMFDGKKILEIGSGAGLWARLLKDEGINIKATDNSEWKIKHRYTDVEKLSHIEALQKYPDSDVLMLCWPNHSSSMADESLTLFKGEYVIYIGEPKGFSCATNEFFDQLKTWKLIKKYEITQWIGVHDEALVYQRI